MPFSSLTDPVDLARAQAALDDLWAEIKKGIAKEDLEQERTRLAYMIASFAHVVLDEADLKRRAAERYRSRS